MTPYIIMCGGFRRYLWKASDRKRALPLGSNDDFDSNTTSIVSVRKSSVCRHSFMMNKEEV